MSLEAGTPGRVDSQAYKADPVNVEAPTANHKAYEKQMAAELLITQQDVVDDIADIIIQNPVNVLQYGAVGDGIVNDTVAINAADVAAAAAGRSLYFPAGTYLGFGIVATAPWYGDGATSKILSSNDTTVAFDFVQATAANWTCHDMAFDGDSSADPVPYNSGNYNTFTGSICLYILGDNFSVRDCVFTNSRSAMIRVANVAIGTIDSCKLTRARAEFGDGIYLTSCSDISITNCYVNDVQRIGIVTESGCTNASISGCTVKLAANQGIDYGGTEVNSGYWSENSTGTSFLDCVAIDTNTNGFVLTTGTVTGLATTSFSNCIGSTAYEVKNAFTGDSGGGTVNRVEFISCKGYDVSSVGISFIAGEQNDSYLASGCHMQMNHATTPTLARAYSFQSEDGFSNGPAFTFRDCTVEYLSIDTSDLQNVALNTACVGPFPTSGNLNAISRVTIDNVRNIDPTIPLYVKAIDGKLIYNISKCTLYVTLIEKVYTKTSFTNCIIDSLTINGSEDADSDVFIENSIINGSLTISTSGRTVLENCDINYTSVDNRILITCTSNILLERYTISNCKFYKDMDSYTWALVLTHSGGNAPFAYISDCIFINEGAVGTAANEFVRFPIASSSFHFADIIKDANVTNLYDENGTPANPSDMTAITFH